MTHLTASVERWGPLWATSAFLFEDANGKLLRFFHGTRGVGEQIFRSFLGAHHLQSLAMRYINSAVPMQMYATLTKMSLSRNAVRLMKNVTALGHSIVRSLTMTELDCVLKQLSSAPNEHLCSNDIVEYQRVVLNGKIIASDSYCQSLKHNDSFIMARSSAAFLVKNFIVVNLCRELNCQMHIPEQVCFLICKPISTSSSQQFDKDVDCNLLRHVKVSEIVDQYIAIRTTEFMHKLIQITDSKSKTVSIVMPQFELD